MDKQVILNILIEGARDIIVEKTIPSKTIKDFLVKTNHEFSVSELVTLIHNSDKSVWHKMALLTYLRTALLIPEDSPYEEDAENIWVLYTEYAYMLKLLGLNTPPAEAENTPNIKRTYNDYIEFKDRLDTNSTQTAIMFEVKMDDMNTEEVRCVNNIETLRELCTGNEFILSSNTIKIVDLKDSSTLYYVKIQDDFTPIDFLYGDKPHTNIDFSGTWVDIPIKFEIGEKVRIHGDETNQAYVVCYDNKVPSEFKGNLDIMDTCITVIPEDKLDKNRGYKEQIDAIISNRIKDLDGESTGELDILSLYHEHISTIFIERVDD